MWRSLDKPQAELWAGIVGQITAMVQTTELILRCPDIHTQEDEMIIHQTLQAAPGIGDVEVDYKTGEVRILTANQDGGLDVRRRLADAGFPPEE
jgi:hypothetical protein